MIRIRFRFPANAQQEQRLIDAVPDMRGLLDLVVGILVVESGFNDNEAKYQAIMREVIAEELGKRNLGYEEVYGCPPRC